MPGCGMHCGPKLALARNPDKTTQNKLKKPGVYNIGRKEWNISPSLDLLN